jgi:hypothetical protein
MVYNVLNSGLHCIVSTVGASPECSTIPLLAFPGGHGAHAAAVPRVSNSWPLEHAEGLERSLEQMCDQDFTSNNLLIQLTCSEQQLLYSGSRTQKGRADM